MTDCGRGAEAARSAANEARRVAETAARRSYGRLLAFLAGRSHDLAAAEDALADAFAAALRTWPRDGLPREPDAWLLTAARRRLVDAARRRAVRADAAPTLRIAAEEAEALMDRDPKAFPDERLKLLFICAHPAIDRAARTPLMLQTVLGLDAARIAPAFLVTPAAMAQRLVRAKTKIRDARIPFAEPDGDELGPRTTAVLEAIYAAYGAAWDDGAAREGLAAEAIDLARLASSLLQPQPEALGLLALLLFCEARVAARRGRDGRYVPLSEQDVRLWSRPLLARAEQALGEAASLGAVGPFQLEAAIQSAHAERARGRPVPWRAIAGLYEALVSAGGGIGAEIGRAAAVAEADGAAEGMALLDAIPAERVEAHQPYFACRAHLLASLDRGEEAGTHYARAIALSQDPAVADWLESRRAALAQRRPS